MRRLVHYILAAALAASISPVLWAQAGGPRHYPVFNSVTDGIELPTATQLPRMAPELALHIFSKRSTEQADKVQAYTDRTVVQAELPDTSQKGEFELVRSFTAPHSLNFATVKFTGDNFVKTNVIIRLLQQEVDHVAKGDPSATAINEQNYKFSYKGVESIEGDLCHVFAVKPRRKAPGLFKGKIYVSAYRGSLRRAEGSFVKSPSFWVKNIEFTQEFDDFDGVTLPTLMRSTAKARIIGRTVVRVFHRGYQLTASALKPTSAALVPGDSK